MKPSHRYYKAIHQFLLLTPLLVFVLGACNIQNHIPQNKALLDENTIEGAPKGHQYQLGNLIQQRPNDKFLGITRMYMWTYLLLKADSVKPASEANWFMGKFTRNLRNKLRNKMGVPPVLLDSSKVKKSMTQMRSYLLHNGFSKNEVDFEVDVKRQKANVKYMVDAGKPYRIKEIQYWIPDKDIYQLVEQNRKKSLLKEGRQYNSQTLQEERDRLTEFLKNQGYYGFSKSYIDFSVDTSYGDKGVIVGVNIRNPGDFQRHKRYKIKNIFVKPTSGLSDSIQSDTVVYDGITFIAREQKVRPKTLANKISLAPGQVYSLKEARETYDRLSQFEIFKFVDIRFRDEEPIDSTTNLIDCHIEMSLSSQREVGLEWEMNTTEQNQQFASSVFSNSRYFGVSPNISYRNKNFFRRGINWNVNLRGGYEFSAEWFDKDKENQNIFEFGVDMSFDHQEGLFTRSLFKGRAARSVNTSIDLSYLIEGNPNYGRNTISLGYTYEFTNRLNRIFFKPLFLNYVRTNISRDTFQRVIDEIDNPFIQSIFDTYTILGTKFGLIYNDKSLPGNDYWNIRWNTELAGNTTYLLSNLLGGEPQKIGNNAAAFRHKIGEVGFYQYIRTRADFMRYFEGEGNNKLVARFSPGIGFSYGNTRFLPFEKRFFVGGSNSIRAWAVRDIGPGSYSSPGESLNARLYQVGDLVMEGNLEYRFDLFYIFKGALFTDFGNVWTLRKEENTPGGVIDEDFASEVAIGSGAGLRFDFTFFVFRTDFGWPVRNPSLPVGDRWTKNVSTKWLFNNARVNIGIGYPF